MGYKIPVKKLVNIREQWSEKRPDFSTEMSADELRSMGKPRDMVRVVNGSQMRNISL